jgi:hypothetical protein
MYVTKAEFRGDQSASQQMITSASSQAISDSDLDKLIERASRYFDLLCGVDPEYFEPAGASATARTFYGDGTHFLKLDRYVAGSLNATISVPSGYTAPTFTERQGYLQITSEDGIPLTRSRYFWSEGWWPNVPITVTAKWGFAATPEDVKHAVIELAVNLWRETDPANVKLVNLEGQPLREKYPPRVKEIADRYRVQIGVLV